MCSRPSSRRGSVLLAYPLLFALLVPDRWRLIGLGFAYLVLALAWLGKRYRP